MTAAVGSAAVSVVDWSSSDSASSSLATLSDVLEVVGLEASALEGFAAGGGAGASSFEAPTSAIKLSNPLAAPFADAPAAAPLSAAGGRGGEAAAETFKRGDLRSGAAGARRSHTHGATLGPTSESEIKAL